MIVNPSLTILPVLTAAGAAVLTAVPGLRGRGLRPEAVVLYPVRERAESVMRQDLAPLAGRRVLAITDHDDPDTAAALHRLQAEVPDLEVLVAPEAADPSWTAAWRSWLADRKAWRDTRSRRRLTPRQRRQVVFGHLHVEVGGGAVIGGVHNR